MPRLIVKGDPVRGVDKHNVSGDATNPSPPPPTVTYTGVGDFSYRGTISSGLSDLLSIDGQPVALTSSRSALDTGEDVAPSGNHSGPRGSGLLPTAPAPLPPTLKITDQVGPGRPSQGAGSGFVHVGGTPVLLDQDPIDTCDGLGTTRGSTVSSSKQSFVTASE